MNARLIVTKLVVLCAVILWLLSWFFVLYLLASRGVSEGSQKNAFIVGQYIVTGEIR